MAEKLELLNPRFVGSRFEDHSIPLEVLKDLAVLEDFLHETAKWHYRSAHPDRSRIPKGFSDSISIRLESIGEGSAIVNIVLVSSAIAGLFPPESFTYYTKASESIIRSISAAEKNDNIAEYLPDSLLPYFDKIGRSLREDESIEFRSKSVSAIGRLNKTTRKALILSSEHVNEYTDDCELIGFIPEADQEKNTFIIRLIDGRRIPGTIDTILREPILNAFNGFHRNMRICLKGVALYNRNGKILNLESIDRIEFLEEFDIAARIEEILLLRDGWLDGYGTAYNPHLLSWLKQSFNEYFAVSLPLPALFPTPEGNIQAEWNINQWQISLDIDLEQKAGQLVAVNTISAEDKESSLDLSSKTGWDDLNLLLNEMSEHKL
jgi:hypothetical protein